MATLLVRLNPNFGSNALRFLKEVSSKYRYDPITAFSSVIDVVRYPPVVDCPLLKLLETIKGRTISVMKNT